MNEVEKFPKSVYRKDGRIYFVAIDPNTKRLRWFPLGKTWREAEPEYRRLLPQLRSSRHVKRVLSGFDGPMVPDEVLKELLRNARKNAKTRALSMTLTVEDLRFVAARAQGFCELSGIAFEYGIAAEMRDSTSRRRRLWAPSLDRIEGARGYEPGNVRLVCQAVNAARQEFGDAVLIKIAHAIVKYPVVSPR
jgi:hypothetical protein